MDDSRAAFGRTFAALALLALAGCATEDPFRKQPVRVAYEVGEQVREARPQFQSFWNWYLGAIDPQAPTTDVEVCLTIAPDGRVLDSYIDSSTIRREEFTVEVLKIYNGMRFAPRDVPELTLCDDPLQFYALGDKPGPDAGLHENAFVYVEPEVDEEAVAAQLAPLTEAAPAPGEAPVVQEEAPVAQVPAVPLKLDSSLKKKKRKKR